MAWTFERLSWRRHVPRPTVNDAPVNPYQLRHWLRWKALGRPIHLRMCLVLDDGSLFWSRGTYAECDPCHGILRKPSHLARFEEADRGSTWTGWSCTGRSSREPMGAWHGCLETPLLRS